jgi:hypothetical protein
MAGLDHEVWLLVCVTHCVVPSAPVPIPRPVFVRLPRNFAQLLPAKSVGPTMRVVVTVVLKGSVAEIEAVAVLVIVLVVMVKVAVVEPAETETDAGTTATG